MAPSKLYFSSRRKLCDEFEKYSVLNGAAASPINFIAWLDTIGLINRPLAGIYITAIDKDAAKERN